MQRILLVMAGIVIGLLLAGPQFAQTHDVPPGATHGDPKTDPALKPLFFLNLDAVKLAAKTGEQEQRPSMKRVPRDILAEFTNDGGIVLKCGPCMQEFGLKLSDLVPGVRMGAPGVTQGYIFAENARTLTW